MYDPCVRFGPLGSFGAPPSSKLHRTQASLSRGGAACRSQGSASYVSQRPHLGAARGRKIQECFQSRHPQEPVAARGKAPGSGAGTGAGGHPLAASKGREELPSRGRQASAGGLCGVGWGGGVWIFSCVKRCAWQMFALGHSITAIGLALRKQVFGAVTVRPAYAATSGKLMGPPPGNASQRTGRVLGRRQLRVRRALTAVVQRRA